jgi:hypothetical protein
MLSGDRQQLKTALRNAIEQDIGIDLDPVLRYFDCNLPHAGHADKNAAVGRSNGFHCGLGQPLIVGQPPEQDVGIEQEIHFFEGPSFGSMGAEYQSASSSSDIGSSKLSPNQTLPFNMPGLRTGNGLAKGANLAIGLPALAMMISSPWLANSTKRESWVLASCMLICRMDYLD